MSHLFLEELSVSVVSHVRMAKPAIYHITAPESLTTTARFSDLDKWEWMKYVELLHCCTEIAHHIREKNNESTERASWETEDELKLLKDFAFLMVGNTWELRKMPVYNYVLTDGVDLPTERDFFLETSQVPNVNHASLQFLYVPARWGTAVLKLVNASVHAVSFVSGGPTLLAHCKDGRQRPAALILAASSW